jgi:osmotically-inducible protein OsmY
MAFGDKIPDKSILKDVDRKLARTGTNSKITATVSSGYVTLRGVLQYENQRRTIIRAANQVSGVRHVTDQMTVEPKRIIE